MMHWLICLILINIVVFSILVVLTAAAAMPTNTNESDGLEYNSKSVPIENAAIPAKPKRRSLGEFFGSILERTPLRNWLPSRCSHQHHHHDHGHDDYDYDDHHDDHHYGHSHHGHHEHRTEPTSASTTLQTTTIRDRSFSPTTRNVDDNLTTTAVPVTTSSTTTITSSSTARYNDPDNELTQDIDLRFGKAR